jgi:chorismate dehydratase
MIIGRLGRMAYVNTLPVDWGLVHGPLGSLVSVERGAPTTLNRLLAEGALDISPVSSVAAMENADEWLVLDGLCIGSRGAVGSVILYTERPVEELDGGTIAVTRASATAVRLLQILLQRHWQVSATLAPENGPATAKLLIGDAALQTASRPGSGFVYDLGQMWHDYTGEGFVFGLWCVRKDFVRARPVHARALYHLLHASYSLGRIDPEGVAAQAAAVTGLPDETIRTYFSKLVYDLDDGLRRGLRLFLDLLGSSPDRLETYRA